MRETYFHRLHAATPTRFWINNPTAAEAVLSIEHGAVSCTTNPTYAGKMLQSGEMRPRALEWIRDALSQTDDISRAAALTQRSAVGELMKTFLPLYEKTKGTEGFVSLQSDPLEEDDPSNIIREALECVSLGPNYLAKIPVTRAGLAAIKEIAARGIPVIATEIMSVAQTVSACEAYICAARESGRTPAFFITSIAGIFDQCLRAQLDSGEISADPDILFQAGMTLTRRQYKLMREMGCPGILLGGGARGLHHFTEFAGGNIHITINWKGSAQTLIEKDEPVICRMDCPTPEYVLDGLMEVPDFARAYAKNGLDVDEYAQFAPVELFRSQFISGWNGLLDEIKAVKG